MREGREPDDSAPIEDAEFTLETSPLDAPPDAPDAAARATLGASTCPRGRRLVALGLTALLVVVVGVGLFVRATSDPAGAVATLLGLATPPSATFVPGANVIYVSDGAPWGILTIDGKRLPATALAGAPMRVARGIHHLAYQARYFPSLRCVFSAPRAKSDTCPLDASQSTLQFLLDQGLARVIDLGSTGATLQRDQRRALIQQANNILAAEAATATIAPGDRYLDAYGRLVTATAPLHFTLTLSLGGSEQAGVGDGYCYQFCPDPSFQPGGQPNLSLWPMRVTVDAQWAITDASGKRITPLTYEAGQPYPGSAPIDVGLALTSTGWTITGLERQNTGVTVNAALAVMANQDNTVGGSGYGATVILGKNPLAGCVLHVSINNKNAHLLWRFGALIALDPASQRIFPQLPLANSAELAAARAIMSHPQFPS